MKESNYELIPNGEPISKSGIQVLLEDIRPVWKDKNLIQRVNRLLPVDPSSACQRLFNAAIHDLKEKILIIGIDLAKNTALKYKLPSVNKEEDILDYNVSKAIDLAYRLGILKRAEWRRIHRCYEIRRDLEHEDDEYEAVLEDCFYIFKSAIDIVLSEDPIELLQVTDAKDLVESSLNISIPLEFSADYKNTPKGRKKEIMELLVSFANDDDKPDIVRENSIELLRHLKSNTEKTVIIEVANILQKKLGRQGISLKVAKISHACGALGYFKKAKLKDFFKEILSETINLDWKGQTRVCSKLEDVGGLRYCPKEQYEHLIEALAKMYIGERSYGQYSSSRKVFFSNGAAPIVKRIFEIEGNKAFAMLEKLRETRSFKTIREDVHLLRRYERLLDASEKVEEV